MKCTMKTPSPGLQSKPKHKLTCTRILYLWLGNQHHLTCAIDVYLQDPEALSVNVRLRCHPASAISLIVGMEQQINCADLLC